MSKAAKPKKTRIQLIIDEPINDLLEELAEKERRTKSAVVEIALLAYADKRADTAATDSQPH
jgi:predicted transcriptional regulator